VGRFYLANLSGAIAGAVCAGFVLIPWLGTRVALIAVASFSLLAGFALLVQVHARRPRYAAGLAAGSLALFAAIAVLLPDPLDAVLARRYGGERLLWRNEGTQATVSVQQSDQRVMYLDGLHQANDSAPMLATHRQIGTLAMALHPRPQEVLVIGLGGGATAGAVAQFPDASVDIIELSPSVVGGAEWFRHANGDVLRRTNVRLRIDDGRNYLLLTPKRYDVITADIIQPFHAGAGNLYSLEYYQLASRALRDDGVMLQWIGHRPASQYKLIARTFLDVFPHTTVWAGGTLLAGTKQPLRLSEARYQERLTGPAHATALAAAGLATYDALLGLYTAGPEELRAFIGDGPRLTDDRPLVEFFLSLPRNEPDISTGGLRGDVNRHRAP
jgi:spermidine synthase